MPTLHLMSQKPIKEIEEMVKRVHDEESPEALELAKQTIKTLMDSKGAGGEELLARTSVRYGTFLGLLLAHLSLAPPEMMVAVMTVATKIALALTKDKEEAEPDQVAKDPQELLNMIFSTAKQDIPQA